MARVTVDFTGIIDYDTPVEPGAYPVRIHKVDLKEAKEKGKFPGLSVQAEITDGPSKGRKLFCYCTLNPNLNDNGNKCNFMAFNLLKACGMEVDANDLDFDTDDLLNVEMTWVMKIDGEGKNQVEKFQKAH